MDENQLAKALVDAGLFRVLGVIVSTPFGVLILIEVLKFFGFKKNKEKEAQEKEDFKCKLYSQEQTVLREYVCKFEKDNFIQIIDIKENVRENGIMVSQVISRIDMMITDLREDRKAMIGLVNLLYERLGRG